MALTIQSWCRASASANEPLNTVGPVGCFREYNYYTADSQLVVAASGYFNGGSAYKGLSADLVTGDFVNVYSSDDSSLMKYRVTNTSGVVTSLLMGGSIQSVTALTAAQINGMYGAPVVLLAAPGADRVLILESVILVPADALTTDYAAGGAVHIQYNATINGGGLIASGTVAAGEFTSDAETTMSLFHPLTTSGNDAVAGTKVENEGLYLSNATQAFTTGTMTYNAYAKASVIAVSAGWN